MEQVSPEVKEAYLNNLTYTTINKRDWKALNREYNVDNASEKQNKYINSMIILSAFLVVIFLVVATVFNNLSLTLFVLSFILPLILFIVEVQYNIVYNRVKKRDRFLHNYRKANDTFNVLIEGNDKYRYYSRWYLELVNPKVEVYESRFLRTGFDEDKRYIHFNSIGLTSSHEYHSYGHTGVSEIYPITRHPDRFNWRNTLSTNRVLSIEEYKNLIKSKEEFKKYMEMEEDIREFQEYNGL